jgi:ElaB/YqjD/DUF883 family membrane-anchored ribosome-binding protein
MSAASSIEEVPLARSPDGPPPRSPDFPPPRSPDFPPPENLAYNPENLAYNPVSPEYNPENLAYNPVSPEYNPENLAYNPVSPEYNPENPAYNPVSPEFPPPQSPGYDPVSPGYNPVSPEFAPPESPEAPLSPPMEETEYNEAVAAFFRLKGKYEKTVKRMKQKILANDRLTKKEKREEFLKMTPKCINCKNPVGTLFTVDNTKLAAVCGAAQQPAGTRKYEPCSLNIRITKPTIKNLESYTAELKAKKEAAAAKIIDLKLRVLFKITPEQMAMPEVDAVRKEFDTAVDDYQEELQKLLTVVYKLDSREQLDEVKVDIDELVTTVKKLVTESEAEDNLQAMREAIETQVKSLNPALLQRRQLKYALSQVQEHDEKHYLREYPYTIEQLEVQV